MYTSHVLSLRFSAILCDFTMYKLIMLAINLRMHGHDRCTEQYGYNAFTHDSFTIMITFVSINIRYTIIYLASI